MAKSDFFAPLSASDAGFVHMSDSSCFRPTAWVRASHSSPKSALMMSACPVAIRRTTSPVSKYATSREIIAQRALHNVSVSVLRLLVSELGCTLFPSACCCRSIALEMSPKVLFSRSDWIVVAGTTERRRRSAGESSSTMSSSSAPTYSTSTSLEHSSPVDPLAANPANASITDTTCSRSATTWPSGTWHCRYHCPSAASPPLSERRTEPDASSATRVATSRLGGLEREPWVTRLGRDAASFRVSSWSTLPKKKNDGPTNTCHIPCSRSASRILGRLFKTWLSSARVKRCNVHVAIRSACTAVRWWTKSAPGSGRPGTCVGPSLNTSRSAPTTSTSSLSLATPTIAVVLLDEEVDAEDRE
mmetsp:Transcript_35509/g.63356  ORF Transcript_35509/g.63356 Transcript_35509/m.63356 type:complete len:360 (-) Transcript_35509:718-1797(-)